MQDVGKESNEFKKLNSSMLNKVSMLNIVTLITLVVMGVIIFSQCNKPAGTTTTTVDTNKVAPVIINNWPASGTAQGQRPPDVNVSGMDSAQLRSMLESYLQKYRELFADYTSVNRYDTTFKDSTYKETLSMEVTRNRLARFTRNMEVYSRSTVMSEPDKVHYFGGVFAQGASERAGLGLMIGIENKKRQLFTVGYDPINKVWVGGVSQRIR